MSPKHAGRFPYPTHRRRCPWLSCAVVLASAFVLALAVFGALVLLGVLPARW